MTDEILLGYQVLLFSRVSEQISRRVRDEVGDASESLSANWQNIFSVHYHRIHSTFPARSALIILMTLIFSLCAVGSGLEPPGSTNFGLAITYFRAALLFFHLIKPIVHVKVMNIKWLFAAAAARPSPSLQHHSYVGNEVNTLTILSFQYSEFIYICKINKVD